MKASVQALALALLVVAGLGDRDSAAGHELGAFARDRGHIRFREGMRDALPLESPNCGVQLAGAFFPNQRRRGVRQRALDGEGIVEVEAAVRSVAAQVDAELLDNVSADFRDGHPQRHLVEAADGQRVDHSAGRFGRALLVAVASAALRSVYSRRRARGLLCVVDEAVCQVDRLLSLDRRRNRAHQDDRVGDRMNLDGVARHRDVDKTLQVSHVASNRHFNRFDLAAVIGERKDGRLTVGEGRHINPPRRADDGVGDPRIADINFGRFLRQVEDLRLPDAHLAVQNRVAARAPRRARSVRLGRADAGRQAAEAPPARPRASARAEEGPPLGHGAACCAAPKRMTVSPACSGAATVFALPPLSARLRSTKARPPALACWASTIRLT